MCGERVRNANAGHVPTRAGLSTSFDFMWNIFKRHYLSVFYPEICRQLCICHVPNVPTIIEAGADGSQYASPFLPLELMELRSSWSSWNYVLAGAHGTTF